MKREHETLIHKKLLGIISDEDEKVLNDWLKADATHRQLYEERRRLWRHRIEQAPEFEPEKRIAVNGKPRIQTRSAAFWAVEGVAIALMIVATGLAYDGLKDRPSVFQSGKSIQSVLLEDSTNVTLKPGSALWISSPFGTGRRAVEFEGEAHFDVKADSVNPFMVMTRFSRIEVTGTSFLLNVNRNKHTDEVHVLSGVVRFSSLGHPEHEVTVTAGKKGVLNRNNMAIALQASDTVNLLAWKKRELVFDETPLKDVAAALADYFGISVRITDPSSQDCPVTRTFRDPTLDEVIEEFDRTPGLMVFREYKGIVFQVKKCR